MRGTKTPQQRFSKNLGRLPSCIPTQLIAALFNFDLNCPLSDSPNLAPGEGTRVRWIPYKHLSVVRHLLIKSSGLIRSLGGAPCAHSCRTFVLLSASSLVTPASL